MNAIEFYDVAEHPELKDLIVRWLCESFGAPKNYEFWRSLVAHCRSTDFPMIYVAFVDGTPTGTVGLSRADILSRQDLCPWLVALYVCSEFRCNGIGSALQDFAIEKAKDLGYDTLYLLTSLTGYYEKKDWEYMGDETNYDGTIVRIYRKKTVSKGL